MKCVDPTLPNLIQATERASTLTVSFDPVEHSSAAKTTDPNHPLDAAQESRPNPTMACCVCSNETFGSEKCVELSLIHI